MSCVVITSTVGMTTAMKRIKVTNVEFDDHGKPLRPKRIRLEEDPLKDQFSSRPPAPSLDGTGSQVHLQQDSLRCVSGLAGPSVLRPNLLFVYARPSGRVSKGLCEQQRTSEQHRYRYVALAYTLHTHGSRLTCLL